MSSHIRSFILEEIKLKKSDYVVYNNLFILIVHGRVAVTEYRIQLN